MTLISLKKFLQEKKFMSLAAVCAQFQTSPENVRCLLQHFLHKGCVRKCNKTPNCGSACFKCDTILTEYYEWIA